MVELKNGKREHRQLGQAMTEYALILVLLAVSAGLALAITGPAIGNVFCNVVHNLGGETASPQGGTCGSAAPDLVALGGDPPLFWATVTWVAGNPQGETPFPTPIRRAPAGSGAVLPTERPPTNTPTFTPSFTPSNTYTPTYTPSPGPSPTNGDVEFGVPYVDQINNPDWWRLDTGDFMGYTDWGVQWYDNMTTSANAGGWLNLSLSGSVGFDNALTTNINGIQYDWGSGVPAGSGIACCSTWGGEFIRTIDVAQTATYKFTLNVNNFANVIIDDVNSGNPIVYRTSSGSSVGTVVIPKGTHTLRIIYAQNSGTASLHLNVDRLSVNPDDQVVGTNACTWGRSGDNNNPVSVTWMFDDNPGSGSTWPGGQTCYLELRGYVNLTSKTHPTFSFWDIWDFMNASGLTAELQVSRYVKDVNGFLDRTQLNWHTIASRGTTRNYNWTRTQIDLSSLNSYADLRDDTTTSGIVNNVTFRFVIGSSSPGSAPFRWYIDDLQIVENTTPNRTFTVGNEWNLDAPAQKADFIFDGDSYDNPALTNSTGPRRWSLTSTHARSGTAWDDSPAGNYQNITGLSPSSPTGTSQARIHYLQLKYPISLASAPAEDSEHDTGTPMLSFWHAFDIAQDASIRVQYATTAAPNTWLDVANQGVLIDYNTPTGSSRTNLSMQPVNIYLNETNIPGASSQPFYIRFALIVDAAATSFGDGWYIDDIRIERESGSPYLSYPFLDDAESQSFSDAAWDKIGGKWSRSTQKAGVGGSAYAYADSPDPLYDANDLQYMQLHFALDLLHDTPTNAHTGDLAAVNPVLSFWHQRYLGSGVDFAVEAWTPISGAWQTIWDYNSDTSAPSFNTQRAWERVEINLVTAISGLYSPTKAWSDIQSNADGITEDDDVKIRFRFQTGGGAPADGVYVDNIRIQNATTYTHKLWPTGSGGNGEFLDSIETVTPVSGTWDTRWYSGGSWSSTSVAGYTRTGSLSLTDSPSGNYGDNAYSVLELVPTIDMTTASGGSPIMTFWTRYQIGSDDTFAVQIAQEDAADVAQGYDKIGGWSAWTTMPMMVGVPAPGNVLTNTAVNTWLRGQVNLAAYAGHRIRVRFVLSVPNTTNQANGIFVDDVKFSYTLRNIPVAFVDNAQTTSNWITEGNWGLGQDYFIGSGANDLGLSSWIGTYFDCELLKPSSNCGDSATYTAILSENADLVPPPFNQATNGPIIGPENVTNGINFNWGSTQRPLNNAAQDIVYSDTFAGRWTRSVTLQPGTTYRVYTISDDGVRLSIDNAVDTSIIENPLIVDPADHSGILIERWNSHPPTMDYYTFTTDSDFDASVPRKLTLEYFENTGGAVMILNISSNTYSFTDSPNTPTSTGFVEVSSVYPGNSSLMLNGFFNLSTASTASLRYKRLYDLAANNFFYVEVSTDGGFNWTTISSETVSNGTRLPPNNDWEQRTINLVTPTDFTEPNVMIRFRLDTRTASAVEDGIYLADIEVSGS